MSLSYSAFCEDLGAPLYNKAWSWCARSKENRLALFTVWEDGIEGGRYVFPTKLREGEDRKKPGRSEMISILDEVIGEGYSAYGIQCRAADINILPRTRQSFVKDRLLDLRIRREGDTYAGQIVGYTPPDVAQNRSSQAAWVGSTAINDIDQDQVTNSDPEYRRRMSGSYVRDGRIRAEVLRRANGSCEYCGQPGFRKVDGGSYLETHHIIALSEQGPDLLHNVIALCPNDHRQAHFGNTWRELQSEFLRILKGKS